MLLKITPISRLIEVMIWELALQPTVTSVFHTSSKISSRNEALLVALCQRIERMAYISLFMYRLDI